MCFIVQALAFASVIVLFLFIFSSSSPVLVSNVYFLQNVTEGKRIAPLSYIDSSTDVFLARYLIIVSEQDQTNRDPRHSTRTILTASWP